MMKDQYIYRNELLKKYIFLALITSLMLSPIYYYIDEFTIGITLNIFSLVTIYLRYSSKNNSKFIFHSRMFMLIVFILFFVFFSNGDQVINSTTFLLLYPIASFSIRGPKEGIIWSSIMYMTFILTYVLNPDLYNIYSFIFFIVAYFMVSYLLYYYRYYEFLNFEEINQKLELKVKQRTKELYEKNIELQKISSTDKLTGINNRLKLDEILESEAKRCDRYDRTLGIIILDIDNFKSVNDTYGHQVGDNVLITIAKIVQDSIRKTDAAGRWGGEEFMIICPECTKDETIHVAQKVRKGISNHKFETVGEKTASFGVSLYYKNMDIDKVVSKADEALYISKHNGKNQVNFIE